MTVELGIPFEEFNFFGFRTEEVVSNKFNDWFVCTLGNTIVYASPASTKAGTPAIKKYANRWLRGNKGFGTIQKAVKKEQRPFKNHKDTYRDI